MLSMLSVAIRNGSIRNTSEILRFFKKRLVELSKLCNSMIFNILHIVEHALRLSF